MTNVRNLKQKLTSTEYHSYFKLRTIKMSLYLLSANTLPQTLDSIKRTNNSISREAVRYTTVWKLDVETNFNIENSNYSNE